MLIKFLEQGLIVLQVASTSMETQDTHENILVVQKVGHCFDVSNMGMLENTHMLKINTTAHVHCTNVYVHIMNMY